MTARPILFSGPMVRSLMEGRKTQTRRAIKKQSPEWQQFSPEDDVNGREFFFITGAQDAQTKLSSILGSVICPYGQPGDLLWVREGFGDQVDEESVMYRADWPGYEGKPLAPRWRPSIHMPRGASRLTLRITDVRVQRLQDISEEDALAEGIPSHAAAIANGEKYGPMHIDPWFSRPQAAAYASLWNSINGPDSWGANPWVWALTFEVVQKNVDEVGTGG